MHDRASSATASQIFLWISGLVSVCMATRSSAWHPLSMAESISFTMSLYSSWRNTLRRSTAAMVLTYGEIIKEGTYLEGWGGEHRDFPPHVCACVCVCVHVWVCVCVCVLKWATSSLAPAVRSVDTKWGNLIDVDSPLNCSCTDIQHSLLLLRWSIIFVQPWGTSLFNTDQLNLDCQSCSKRQCLPLLSSSCRCLEREVPRECFENRPSSIPRRLALLCMYNVVVLYCVRFGGHHVRGRVSTFIALISRTNHGFSSASDPLPLS